MNRTATLIRTFLLVFLPGYQLQAQFQPPGNEWINYQQTYFKVPVVQAGIYRITQAELQRAGLPTTVDPTTLQLFHRGVEQAIYVEGENDKQIDPSDYLEFYGRGNDGAPDSLLYRTDGPGNRPVQPHTYYSLFSDTTAYFVTWRLDDKPGKRMPTYTDTDRTGLVAETYHWQEDLRVFTETYPGYAPGIPPKIEYSDYEVGEGHTGLIRKKGAPYAISFTLTNAVRNGPAPQLEILLAGREFINHRVECLVGSTASTQRQTGRVDFSLYDNARIQPDIAWTDIGPAGQVVVSTVSRGDNGTVGDPYSVSYIRLRYPQKIKVDGRSQQTYELPPNQTGRSLVDAGPVSSDTHIWDITDPTSPIRIGYTITATGSAQFVLRNTSAARTILIRAGTAAATPKSVPAIRPVMFINWANRRPTYLIVSHEALMKPATGTVNAVRSYAAYRASPAGGSHDTLTVTMQQLIDQFSYGERHPLAIRRFIAQLIRQSSDSPKKPTYLLLLGRGRSAPGVRRDPQQPNLDMVMTYGFPPSDLLFSTGLNGFPPDVPALMTARINASTPQEVVNYLDKVIDYERPQTDTQWRKNLLHLSGGKTPYEVSLMRQLIERYRDQVSLSSLGARVITISKQTDNPTEQINIVKPVNEGLGVITFFGHSGLDVTDLDIGFCSNDALGYQNKGKYPFLLINGCAIGNIFFGRPTLTADWVLTAGRGAIAALAQTHLGYVSYLNEYSSTFYSLLSDSLTLNKPIGYLQQETIRRALKNNSDGQMVANCQQMSLQGDPAVRLFPFDTPDYVVMAGGLTVRGADGQALSTLSDSVHIRAVLQNAGQYRTNKLPVRVRRSVDGRELGTTNLVLPTNIAYSDTITLTILNERDTEGLNQFELTVNPTGAITESNRSNNSASVDVTVIQQRPVMIYPPAQGIVQTRSVSLTARSFSSGSRLFDLQLDTTNRFTSPALVSKRVSADGLITYTTTLPGPANTTFFWRVRTVGDSLWSTASFSFDPTSTTTGLPEGQIELASALPTDIRQGDLVKIPVKFTNLSPYAFSDSLVVRQTLYAAGLTNPLTTQWKQKAPAAGDTLRFSTQIDTKFAPGFNWIVLTVNPRLQPEYSYLNNTVDLLIPVQPDVLGPVLEVAIDGLRIAEGAVVSARPTIDVLVADDNRSLLRRDTTGVDLYLQRPGQSQAAERIRWRDVPAQPAGSDNVFRTRLTLAELVEGNYRLLVTARDAVGNPANPYQVGFRVVDERSLTDLTVYPNPFRDRVLFAAQLTGRQAPNALTFTIRDLAGRIVRRMQVTGRIGLNEWVWNGQSDTGASLPAGIYLYSLTVSNEGQEWPVGIDAANKRQGRLILVR
jgi:hypothetical protein